jgi:hypothetical protein
VTEPPRILANTRQVQMRTKFHREIGEIVDLFHSGLKEDRVYAKTDMPGWLVDRLDRAGWIDASTGAGRQARSTRCRDCGGHVMRGLTEHPMALSVDADPHPLTALGEAVCILGRRPTYELRYLVGGRYDLDHRDQWRIAERPAGRTRNVDVLARHICGKPPPPPWAPTMLVEPTHVTTPEEPPF